MVPSLVSSGEDLIVDGITMAEVYVRRRDHIVRQEGRKQFREMV
jgi:hypothetical protein